MNQNTLGLTANRNTSKYFTLSFKTAAILAVSTVSNGTGKRYKVRVPVSHQSEVIGRSVTLVAPTKRTLPQQNQKVSTSLT